ncbi:MAG: murein L,D-transpeptidase catalytic domain family protein [Chitinophagales bacterium]
MPPQKPLKKPLLFAVLALLFSAFSLRAGMPGEDEVCIPVQPAFTVLSLYSQLHLDNLGLNFNTYNLAVHGWQKLKATGKLSREVLAICDFTQSSSQKRLYVIDMLNGKLLFNTLVAHGRNTGEEFAQSFSNQPSSNKSSLGFYCTGETYQGGHGLSLKLRGQEPGFNDNAEERAIVMHGAEYVNTGFIAQNGRLGRSFGCPAVSVAEHEQIINAIKGGSCLFIYYPDGKYLASSKLLH